MGNCATPLIQPTPPSTTGGGGGGLSSISITEVPSAKLYDITALPGTGVINFEFELFPQYKNKVWAIEAGNPATIGTPDYRWLNAYYLNPTFSAGQYLTVDAGGNLSWASVSGGGGGGGTVTSVSVTAPSIFGVTGNPITTSGTIALTLATQTANTVFAGATSGGASAPTFRSLVSADIPNLDTAKLTSGILPTTRGGTGLGTIGTAGQYLRSDGSALAYSAILATDLATYSSGTRFLSYNGTALSWATVTASPAGLDTYVQFNDAMSVGAQSSFAYNKVSSQLVLTGNNTSLSVTGGYTASTYIAQFIQTTADTTTNYGLFAWNASTSTTSTTMYLACATRSISSVNTQGNHWFFASGNIGLRKYSNSAPVANTNGHVEIMWVSGDTLTTMYVGSSTTTNNQIAIRGVSYTNFGVNGESTLSSGVRASSSSGYGLWATSTSSNAIYATNSSSSDCIYSSSSTGKALNAISTSGIAVQAGSSSNTGLYAYSTSSHGIVAESYGTNGRCVSTVPYHANAYGLYVNSGTTGSSRTAPLIYAQSAETNDFPFIQCYDTTGSMSLFEVRRNRGTKIRQGMSTGMGYVGGRVKMNYASLGNSGTTETMNDSLLIRTDSLNQDGDCYEFEIVFTFASNANNKRIRLLLDTVQVYDSGTQAQNGGTLMLKGKVIRTSISTQKVSVQCISSGTLFSDEVVYTATSLSLSGMFYELSPRLTGGASNDILQQIFTAEWYPNAS